MSTSTKPNGPDNDDDIARVFNAQPVQVPDSLRKAVLLQASQLSRQQSSDSEDSTNLETSTEPTRETSKTRLPKAAWLSAAATIVIAVAVAPLLLTAPQSSLEPSLEPSVDTSLASESEEQLMIETAPPEQITSTSATSSSALQAPASSAKTLSSDAAADAPQMQQRKESTASDSLPLDAEMAEEIEFQSSTAYRSSAAQWMERIDKLIADGDTDTAREEYRLFSAKHPNEVKSYIPDFDAEQQEDVRE